MDPVPGEGEGRRWGERRRRGQALFFILASSFPWLLPAAAVRTAGLGRGGESSGPAARPEPGPAHLPAGLPFPRRPDALPRSRGRARWNPRAARRTRGPCQAPPAGPALPAQPSREDCGGTFLAESARADAVRDPESPRMRDVGVGWGGWKALRWRWAWPVARAGGAVAPRTPSSSRRGRRPSWRFRWPSRCRPPGEGATLGVLNSANGAGVAPLRAGGREAFPAPPDPKAQAAGLEREGLGSGVLLFPTCFLGKKCVGVGLRG
ncbi:LOW QUALITY PROTEIN: uncharacterized protein LOC101358241 [Trichechus manatus latirostris]|uniref:LOW QUALITY PROTEIN: uncharacterized protein LOC101358241 n=1 Tax=Trichechus manatus latirostris TaxID=127582 RepID=A0A2Y9REK8_TRIMA|nr:LOW QUALITY PROTEIN: uncharacterized protein LOC101358241 [Trichechus manatus latirostris]